MVDSTNTEIRSQSHLMDAEGTAYSKPVKKEILKYIESKGFIVIGLSIWKDEFQNFWRWNCDIRKLFKIK